MGDRNRSFQNSNVNQTQKISKSVFVTNFPDTTTARDLWKTCNAYGTVVDVFIPFKRSKAGKKFAFVRFIKVTNLDRLVENLCTIWIGRFHLYANQVRFERPQKPNFPTHKETTSVAHKNSFASVLKEGHVKEVSAIPNLPVMISKEGFQNVKHTYLGEGKPKANNIDETSDVDRVSESSFMQEMDHVIDSVRISDGIIKLGPSDIPGDKWSDFGHTQIQEIYVCHSDRDGICGIGFVYDGEKEDVVREHGQFHPRFNHHRFSLTPDEIITRVHGYYLYVNNKPHMLVSFGMDTNKTSLGPFGIGHTHPREQLRAFSFDTGPRERFRGFHGIVDGGVLMGIGVFVMKYLSGSKNIEVSPPHPVPKRRKKTKDTPAPSTKAKDTPAPPSPRRTRSSAK
ncbi:RNA-directed DNA polymerase, eukaryota [Tanacetum coccineum]